MLDFRFAKKTIEIGWRGRVISLVEGQVWAGDDAFLLDRPELFSIEPIHIAGSGVRSEDSNVRLKNKTIMR